MAKSRILIIERDTCLIQAIRELLLKHDFELHALSELRDTRVLRENSSVHLVLLESSIDALQRIREDSEVPVFILSASADSEKRVQYFEAGADDVLDKPLNMHELVPRMRAVLRRSSRDAESKSRRVPQKWSFKGLSIDANRRRVIVHGEKVELTTAEFDLLRLLVADPECVFSREAILERLRGIEWAPVDRSVDILVSRLREKLRDNPREPHLILTIRNLGYQFIGEQEDFPVSITIRSPHSMKRTTT